MKAKAIISFLMGYLIGAIMMISSLLVQGDELTSAVRIALLWIPVVVVYVGAISVILRRYNIRLPPMLFSAVGACLGVLPLVSGLWPVYWMRWDVAILFVSFHGLLIAAVIASGLALQKVRFKGRS